MRPYLRAHLPGMKLRPAGYRREAPTRRVSQTLTAALAAGAVLLLLAFAQSAVAQQNPFVGTWSTSLRLPNGSGYSAFVDFYPNGALHLSGVVTSGGQPLHLCGSYRFDQMVLQTVFTAYAPHLCAMGMCEPPPLPLNQPMNAQYQFPNSNVLVISDGTHYVRAPGNPFPLPPSGCN